LAPPRKKKRAPGEGHPVHLRLPTDVFEWIEERAEKEGWSLNRTIINSLAEIPALKKVRAQEDILEDMRNVLARYGSRIELADLSERLLRAVDEVLAAHNDGELRPRLDKLRVLRVAMLKNERASKE
jgi:hypothetical protein